MTHGLGALASVAGLAVLVHFATLRGDGTDLLGVSIFGGTLVLVYLASTFYHTLTSARSKRMFRLLDHTCIYLLIAGSYTPFALALRGGWGLALFGIMWTLAAAGVAFKVRYAHRYPLMTVCGYIVMGWLALMGAGPLTPTIHPDGLMLYIAGGLTYAVGVPFFMLDDRMRFSHTVWHVCVLIGSACHFVAVLVYVLP